MRIEKLKQIRELHSMRRQQVIDLFNKVSSKNGQLKSNLGARSIEEVDVIFEGYLKRNEALMNRLNSIDFEYMEIQDSLVPIRFLWFFPIVKITKESERLMNAFIDKWEAYEPGW
jgi:hypothetical protein